MRTQAAAAKARTLPDWLPYAGVATILSVLIVILTTVAIRQESLRYSERAASYTQNIAGLLTQHVEDVFVKTDALLRSTSFHYLEQRARGAIDSRAMNAYIERQHALFGDIADLRVVDTKGILRYGSGEIAPIDVGDRDYFTRARDEPSAGLVFSGPLFTRLSKKWVLVLARRLTAADGTFAGVVHANMDVERFSRFFAEVDTGASGTVALRTADMVQIHRYPPVAGEDNGVGNRKVSQQLQEAVARQQERGTYLATSPLDNIERTYSYSKVGRYPFYIIVGRASGDFMASWRTNAYLLLGLSGLMLLVTVGGTWRIYRLSQEQATRRSESHAALIMQASPVAMLLVDARGLIRRVNEAASTLLGETQDALLGTSVDALLPQRYRGQHAARRAGFMGRSTPRRMGTGADLVVLHRSGREIPIQIALATIVIEGAQNAIAVLEDQTERQRSDRALHELLALQTAILDHAAYAIIAADAQGLVTVFNKAAERMYGYAAEAVVGKLSPMVFHAPEQIQERAREVSAQRGRPVDAGFEVLVEACRNGTSISDEMIQVRRDGSRFPASRSITALRNPDGEITGYLAITADISQRRAQEEKLNATLARLKLATDAAEIGVWSWSFADDRLEWDQRMCDWYEVPEAALKNGLSYAFWRSRLHPDDLPQVEAVLAQARSHNSPSDDVFRIVLPADRIRHIHSASVVEQGSDGKALRMIGINRDITAQRELEAQLRAAKLAADAANQAKSDFLANMSHEIRTPMNVIIGLTGLLTETELSLHQRDFLDKVHNSAMTLLRILNDILDYSKIEAGHLQIEQTAFELGTVFAGVSDLFAARLAQKHLAWHAELDPAIPPLLIGDPLRLGQVLINLVGNAIKFTDHGEIRLTSSVLTQTAEDVTLQMQIRDTGVGISEDQIGRLFATFVQADASISRKYGGTGLGLSITRRLVELMGGEITVASVPGQGSSFTFSVKLRRVGEAAAAASERRTGSLVATAVEASAPSAAAIRGAHLLLVEDNPAHRIVAEALLATLGLRVTEAHNGRMAVAATRREAFAAILMDIEMPDMDGLEATRRIRAELGDACPPIIAVTAHAMPHERDACLAAGMVGHIAKPLVAGELLATLLEWIPANAADGSAAESGSDLAVDRTQLGSALTELDDLLSRNVFTARRCCEKIETLLQGSALGVPFQPVAAATRQLKFKEASAALKVFLETLGSNS